MKTVRIKTKELIGAPLDWAVEKARNPKAWNVEFLTDDERASTEWAQGGPIIDQMRKQGHFLLASADTCQGTLIVGAQIWTATGPTPLIAAMRCFVASKLGNEVDVPEKLNA